MDKTSKKVLEFLKSKPNCEYKFNQGFQDILPPDEFERCIQYMVQNDYVKPIYSNGIIIGYGLTHQSVHKREFSWLSFKKYLKDNWIAILALIISIASIVLSPFFSAFFAAIYHL